MFIHPFFKTILKIAIAMVWLINGLFCKVMNMVPRHQQIVAQILGYTYAGFFTKIIGVLEIGMTVWVLSNVAPEWCAVAQIVLVIVMNIIEMVKAPQLLLFGRINIVVALLFIAVVYFNAFVLPHYI